MHTIITDLTRDKSPDHTLYLTIEQANRVLEALAYYNALERCPFLTEVVHQLGTANKMLFLRDA